jgi:cellulose synthase operon protein C
MTREFMKPLKFAAAGFAALMLASCGSVEERAQGYYESGAKFLEQKDYPKAAIEFRNALKLKEDHADAWFGMAQIEEQAQNWPRVAGDLNKVLEIEPKHLKALEALAKFNLLAGDFPEALKRVNAAYDIDSKNPNIVALKAAVLFKLNDQKGARLEADKALALKPNHADASIIVASLLLESGDQAGALAAVDGALVANPDSLGVHLLKLKIFEIKKDVPGQEKAIRGLIAAFPDRKDFKSGLISFLVKTGRSEEAEKEMRQAVAANPTDSDAGLGLVRFLRGARGVDAAREELEKLVGNSPQPFAYQLELADADYRAGRVEESMALLRDMVKQLGVTDQGMSARLNLAGKLLDQKQFSETDAVVAEILKNDARNVGALKLQGALETERGNLDVAIASLREALNFDTKDHTIRLLLAVAYERKASFELASKELADAYKQSNGDPLVGLSFATFQLRRGSADRAEGILTEVVSRAPRNKEALSLLAELRLRKQDWAGAEALAKLAKSQGGGDDVSEQILGASLLGQKRFDEAISHFEAVSASAPDDIQPMFALIRAYIASGKVGEAEAFAQSALKANPENPAVHIILGSVMLAQNKMAEAKASLETSISKDDTSPAGYIALARFHAVQGKRDEAIAVLAPAAGKVKDSQNLRMGLAGLYEAAGQFDKAIEQYEFLVADDPNSVVAVNNLVSLLCDHGSGPDVFKRAADLAAILRDSPIPQFRETLGWALVKNGDIKAGLQILERSITELGNLPAAQYHLGLAYAAAGEKPLAEKHLNLALNLEKNPETNSKIQSALKSLATAATP